MKTDCIFCKIIKNEIESTKIYEDSLLLAFLDIQPVNSGHVLIVPKKCVEFISDLDDESTQRMFLVASKINAAIRNSNLRCEGVNYFLADGEAAMQEVAHTHLHVFPRFEGDGFGLVFSDEYETLPTRTELNKIGEMIRSRL
jgi:histidine triad (HIT) family protein